MAGCCLGSVCGLVGVTPAAGFVSVGPALFIGFATASVCYLSMWLMSKQSRVDDTLDVFSWCGARVRAMFARAGW